MTAIEERLSSCTFSDALYVTADEGRDGVISSTELTASDDGAINQHEINRKSRFTSSTSNVITDTSTEYFSAQTHQTYTSPFSSADDSGLSCTPPLLTQPPFSTTHSVSSRITAKSYDSCYPADVESTTDVDLELLQKTLEDSDIFSDEKELIGTRTEDSRQSNLMTSDEQDNHVETTSDEEQVNKSITTTTNDNKNSSKDSDQTISPGGGGRKTSSTSNNSFIIVATSHKRHLSPSSSLSSSCARENNGNGESRRRLNNDGDGDDEKAAAVISYRNHNDGNEETSSWSHIGDESTTSSVYHRLESDSSFGIEQPSMEYEDAYFEPCAQSSPTKDDQQGQHQQKREKIFIRELSFDELQDIQGLFLCF